MRVTADPQRGNNTTIAHSGSLFSSRDALYRCRACPVMYVDPAGEGCTNTIQRVELSAIRAAIAGREICVVF